MFLYRKYILLCLFLNAIFACPLHGNVEVQGPSSLLILYSNNVAGEIEPCG